MDGSSLSHKPKNWLKAVFAAKSVQNGSVIRRKTLWVDQEIGRARFENEVRRCGFRLLETRNHLIVICNSEPVHLVI